MSVIPLLNARVFHGGLDVSAYSNQVELGWESEALDSTVLMTAGGRTKVGGLGDSSFSFSGFWEAGDPSKPDDRLFADLKSPQPVTVGPVGAAVGDLAYVVRMFQSSYTFGGQVGELLPFSAEGMGSGQLGRGVFLHDPGTARTANGSGTGVQWIAVPSGQTLVAGLHVLSVAGTAAPSLTVNVQSSVNVGFSSPTTRLTFNAATAVSGQTMQLAGPVTDTYWRVTYGITGTTPSFLFVTTIGIAP